MGRHLAGLALASLIVLTSSSCSFDFSGFAGPYSYEPAWTPDGKRIAYVSGSYNIVGDYFTSICVMNADGSNKQVLIQGDSFTEVASPDFTPEGQLVYERGGAVAGAASGGGGYPAVSPDGDSIAYVSAGNVYVARTNGLDDRMLAPGEEPAWSPDGSRLVFASGATIAVINIDGSGLTRLTAGEGPDWSPDGKRIVFQGSSGIVAMDLDGSHFSRLTSGTADFDPVWSPDGSKIAFQRGNDIYVMKANGSGEKRIAKGAEECGQGPGAGA
jgi:Tol biopolymer transport system component